MYFIRAYKLLLLFWIFSFFFTIFSVSRIFKSWIHFSFHSNNIILLRFLMPHSIIKVVFNEKLIFFRDIFLLSENKLKNTFAILILYFTNINSNNIPTHVVCYWQSWRIKISKSMTSCWLLLLSIADLNI